MIRDPDDIQGLRYAHGIDEQAGVLAWLPNVDPVRFVVVTSRRTRRWVLPKGGVDNGMTPMAAAAQEALEEAGVIGQVATTPVGRYRQPKIRPPLIWAVEITLYALEIEEILDVWIEADQRERRFVTLAEAAELVTDAHMLSLMEHFAASLRSQA